MKEVPLMIQEDGIPWEKGKSLPFYPGDELYCLSEEGGFEIVAEKIDGIAVYKDRCCALLGSDVMPIDSDPSADMVEYCYFSSKEKAEEWKTRHMPDAPFRRTEAYIWLSPDLYVPYLTTNPVYVRQQTLEGTVDRKAYYDDGSKYPEDKGFWDGLDRHSKRIENVIAWIDIGGYELLYGEDK